MPTHEQIAQVMYDAWGSATDWASNMPAVFEAAPIEVQKAWIEVAKSAIEQLSFVKPGLWRSAFDERSLKEINFAQLYAKDYHHGTDGHIRLMIIAALADLLDGGVNG